jgi:TonB family protein
MSEVSDDQLDLIIRHEVQHIRARDPWIVAGVLVLRVLFPWHPGMWALTAGLRQAIEVDCDRRVLNERLDVRSYGETVLAVASRMRPGPAQPAAAFTESVRFIKRRLLAMTQPQKRLGHYGALSLVALVALVLVGACETPVPSFQPEEPLPELQEVEIPATEVEIADLPLDESATPQAGDDPTFLREVIPQVEHTFTVAPSITNRDDIVAEMERQYPPLLRDAGVGGTVRIMMFVDAEGVLTDLRIHESSGHQALDDGAMRVARTFRFNPALDGDTPVATWIQFPITFQVR